MPWQKGNAAGQETLWTIARLIQLFPEHSSDVDVHGLYLRHRVHRLGSPQAPFVYANFVTSVDGRIALRNAAGDSWLPKELTSSNDFRLFRELHAQADCLITHGGYLRALEAGRLGNVLQVGVHNDAELADWRLQQGLSAQPAVVIASSSLEFELPDSLRAAGQTLLIATGSNADARRVDDWRDKGIEVLTSGAADQVEGAALVSALGSRGYRSLYLVAGPQMLATMLADRQLDRLYLTQTHRIFGGDRFDTIFSGLALPRAVDLRLSGMYYDDSVDTGQLFSQYELEQDTRSLTKKVRR